MKSTSLLTKHQKREPFRPQAPVPLRKLPGVKTYPQGQVPPEPFVRYEINQAVDSFRWKKSSA